MRPIERVRFFVGPMSKNVVDAVIEFCDENGCHELFGLIPSRRQVDVPAGYANRWTTPDLVAHVAGKLVIQRDHAGPCQGAYVDSGLGSLADDVIAGITALHVDPWKAAALASASERDAAVATASMMAYACRVEDGLTFEIGTEQAVRAYDARGLRVFIDALKDELARTDDLVIKQDVGAVFEPRSRLYDKVTHIVVQTGVRVGDLQNSGTFDGSACHDMVAVCAAEGKLVKEHNSDYLTRAELVARFRAGIDAFNFAPEFGVSETKTVMRLLRHGAAMHSAYDEFKGHCVSSSKWHRWVSPDSPDQAKAYACGHYFFSEPWCIEMLDALRAKVDLDGEVKATMKERLREFTDALEEAGVTWPR